jgi:predicted transposase/invertase (TIGR01784 family)
MSKYINPYTDFGFKKLFGEEGNKDLLIDFLNELLPHKHQIADLTFENVEILPDTEMERKAFFDIHCTAISGERFNVEMQKAKVKHFKDRALFYTTFPIRDQAKQGKWNFKLNAVYFVAVLDFWYEMEDEAIFRRDVHLKDQANQTFSDKLNFIFLQMPAFQKTETQLETRFDKWAYFLKNLESFENIPQILNEPIFSKAFATAEMAKMHPQQRNAYAKSKLDYIGIIEVANTAKEEGRELGREEGREQGREQGREEGREQGREEEKKALVIALCKDGDSPTRISKLLGIPIEKVQQIIFDHQNKI